MYLENRHDNFATTCRIFVKIAYYGTVNFNTYSLM